MNVYGFTAMSTIGQRGVHYLQKLKAANVPAALIEKGQNRVIDASLTLIRERAKLKVYVNLILKYLCPIAVTT